jgi:hypothetical protein
MHPSLLLLLLPPLLLLFKAAGRCCCTFSLLRPAFTAALVTAVTAWRTL